MKYIKLILILLLFIPINIKAQDLELNSKYALLYNIDTNEILMEKNSNQKTAIASLTKIMTTIVAIENINNIKKVVTIPEYALENLIELEASVAGFKVDQEVTYEDLLYAIMLPSGADAAKTVAYHIAGNEENFVKLMNEKAQKLELKDTKYYDTTGLDDNNYSTVSDIAKLLKYCLNNETFYKIFTTQEYTTTSGIKLESTLNYYTKKYFTNKYIYGSKTGFTDIAGYCLASIAKDNQNNHLILITLKAPTDNKYPYHFNDAYNTYEYYFNNYHKLNIYNKNNTIYSIKTKYSTEDTYKIKTNNTLDKYVENNITKNNIKIKYDGIDTVTPFTQKGKIGTITIYLDNEKIQTMDINYDGSLSISIPKLIKEYTIFIVPFIIILILILLTIKKKKH